MTKALLLLLSAALIAAGVVIVWRDVNRKRRQAFLVRGDTTVVHPEVEVVVSRVEPDISPRGIAASRLLAGGAAHGPKPAARWAALRPVVDAAVERVNAVLAGAGVAIGAPGEPFRSLMKRGYGVHRRVLIGGESVAWLRLELDGNGQVQASVKSHKDDLAAINAGASADAAALDVARASDLLSECLKLAAAYAVRVGGGPASPASPKQLASEVDWKAIDAVVAAALRAANGAMEQADARFIPLGAPTWAENVQRHRLSIKVEVLGTDAARLHIERIGGEIEVAVGVAEVGLAGLGRRERLSLQGLSIHALAALIAACAWPAIAHVREMRMLA